MNIFDLLLHSDEFLLSIVKEYGILAYLFLFLIIFIETGLVIMPFLPGDSLLFVAGVVAAQGFLNIVLLIILLSIAAILGDSLNYWIGNYFGERVFSKSRFFKREYLEKTKEFYKKYGSKTILLARFIPIVRTFAPFVAGIGKMRYKTFLLYNLLGGVIWVFLLTLAGFFFGNIQIVKDNLTLFIIAIIILSILPAIIEYFRSRRKSVHFQEERDSYNSQPI